MKVCYLDCFSGISGDMLLGAFVDAGLPVRELEGELRKLDLTGWQLQMERVRRGALTALQLSFKVEGRQPHRTWKTIRALIQRSAVEPGARRRAEAIFGRLAEVEGQIHGTPPEEVHFHEVGGVDSILDIVGAAVALERLEVEKLVVSPLNLGSGTVQTAHGTLPVPAPATSALLSGAPVYSSGIQAELVTPTGAAIVATQATSFGPLPRLVISSQGYGAGTLDLQQQPNVLRIFLGDSTEAGLSAGDPVVTVLEANLDDMSPLLSGYFLEQALAAGAHDVYYTSAQMKKNRPGVVLTVICPPERADALVALVFEQTTTIGLRLYEARRRVLEREWVTVETSLGPIRMKLAKLNGRLLNAAPEYDDCQRLAREKSVPLKQVLAEAQFCFRQQFKDSD